MFIQFLVRLKLSREYAISTYFDHLVPAESLTPCFDFYDVAL